LGILREAAEWRLLGLLFECPSAAWRANVAQVAEDVSDPELRSAAAAALAAADEGLYHSIFGPGGPAPPREATHRDTLQLGYLIAELEAFYDAFGYPQAGPEPPDHLSVEAGFAAFLKFKEAFAEAAGDTEAAAVARDAAREFLAEHLATIAGPIATALAGCGVSYLEAAARALARRAGPAKPRFVILDPAGAGEDSAFACGGDPAHSETVSEEETLL
jgi:TorA maturation chaperone TorD